MDVVTIIRDLGLPSALIAATVYGIWSGSRWVSAQIIVPLRDRHFAFLGSLESTLSVLAKTQQQLGSEIERITVILEGGKICQTQNQNQAQHKVN